LAVGEARPPAAEWAALATGGALAVWWSFRRSAPPPWSLVAFLLASAVLLAVRVDMGGAVVFVVIGTGLASVATAKRSCCGSSASVPPCSPGCWRGCAPVRRWR
jgi:cell division protein FtsW (lipid II flippase)